MAGQVLIDSLDAQGESNWVIIKWNAAMRLHKQQCNQSSFGKAITVVFVSCWIFMKTLFYLGSDQIDPMVGSAWIETIYLPGDFWIEETNQTIRPNL